MRVHHIALLTTDPPRLAAFYMRLFGLEHVQTHYDGARVRAVWLQLGDAILMIERSQTLALGASGWQLLALRISPAERAELKARCLAEQVAIESETDYTFYVKDSDGNRVGLSHYPEKAGTLSP